MTEVLTAIGLMSGTSLDAVDVAVVRTDGQSVVEPGPALSFPYKPSARAEIRRAIKAALEGRLGAVEIGRAAAEVTEAHIGAVRRLMAAEGLSFRDIDVIGFHGQTILHRPSGVRGQPGRTLQIGSGARLAEAIGARVVEDFRSADVEAGGEGAPLAPVYHAALAARLEPRVPRAVLNLGGVANVTFLTASCAPEAMLAFDCGPGNGLIDQWAELKTGAPMDRDGELARQGVVDEAALKQLLTHSYFAAPPPKSLDRYDFSFDAVHKLSTVDGAATLTAFTAQAAALAARHAAEPPQEWIACGGGRRNPALMDALNARLGGTVRTAEDVGWRGDDLEAEAFAYMAVRSLNGLAISFPGTTGVAAPMCGGAVCDPQAVLRRQTGAQ
ncbi:MAG: anhydro-N-acetylmuramic acid kinase [Pseudomonadota bacterium]